MHNEDLEGVRTGGLLRLVGVTLSTVLVAEYVVLGAAIFFGRLLLGVAGETWRRLSSSSNRKRQTETQAPEAA